MNQLLTGSGAIATLTPPKYEQIFIESVTIDVPLSDLGSTNPSVTLSGSYSGVYTFHSSVSTEIAFTTSESVTVSVSNFSSGYSAIIDYIYKGSGVTNHQFIDLNRTGLLLPNRLLHPITPVNASGDLH